MKNYFFVLAFLFTLLETDAQSIEVLSKCYETYQANWPLTKLHLIFNQEKFSPGDTAFFKAYFLNENLIGIKDIQIINLDVVDSKGQSVIQFKFKVNNGIGQNQIPIPNDIQAGIYVISAYSSWMKNFDPELIFKKKITIVKDKEIVSTEKREPKIAVEGGHLIREVPNNIGVLAYSSGSSIEIIDERGQVVGKIITDTNGVGAISFVPKVNGSYSIQISGIPKKIPLPPVENDGIAVVVTPSKEDERAKIIITSPINSISRKDELTMILSAKGKIYYTVSIQQGSQPSMTVLIPELTQRNLPEGIIHLSFLNRANDLIANRDFYNYDTRQVYAAISITKNSFQSREKVTLEVSITGVNGLPLEGEFAIDVLNDGLFNGKNHNSLSDELNFLSDVKDDFLIDRTDPAWITNLNNFLIVDTEPLPWKDILVKKFIKPHFPFSSTILKKGKVYITNTHLPAPDNTKVMFYLQKDLLHYQTFTLGGKVMLTVPDIYGQDEFFYFAEKQYGGEIPSIRIEWENDTIMGPFSAESKETELADMYASFVAKNKLIGRSYGFYNAPKIKVIDNNELVGLTSFESEIAEADITIIVDDYTVFPTMTELVKEVIPSLRRRTKDGKNIVLVSLPEPMLMPITDPLYIIDGIATRNSAFFLSLKSADVLAVKIINTPKKLQPLGLMGKSGIVIVQTKRGDAREPLEDLTKIITGLNKPVNFRTYDYSTRGNLREPDFRSTIFWNPLVKTDSNGMATVEFYCSDDIGRMTISIGGMAIGGKPFSADHSIEVVRQKKN